MCSLEPLGLEKKRTWDVLDGDPTGPKEELKDDGLSEGRTLENDLKRYRTGAEALEDEAPP